ncbi:MAG: DUF4406 domain-containing protein [Chitinophagaceae bacterium]|nr:MAG: DUF4406 domain-containing protein [Chitinophagaceae bacterium]
MILVAGPYRSGTADQPHLIEANVKAMTGCALRLYRRGHLPVLGEWVALPLIGAAGSTAIGDAAFNEIFHPVALRLIGHCDAVLRIGGPSAGADEMVHAGAAAGKRIFYRESDIPDGA